VGLLVRFISLKPQVYRSAAIHFRNDFTLVFQFSSVEMDMDKKQELRLVARKMRSQEKEMKKKGKRYLSEKEALSKYR